MVVGCIVTSACPQWPHARLLRHFRHWHFSVVPINVMSQSSRVLQRRFVGILSETTHTSLRNASKHDHRHPPLNLLSCSKSRHCGHIRHHRLLKVLAWTSITARAPSPRRKESPLPIHALRCNSQSVEAGPPASHCCVKHFPVAKREEHDALVALSLSPSGFQGQRPTPKAMRRSLSVAAHRRPSTRCCRSACQRQRTAAAERPRRRRGASGRGRRAG